MRARPKHLCVLNFRDDMCGMNSFCCLQENHFLTGSSDGMRATVRNDGKFPGEDRVVGEKCSCEVNTEALPFKERTLPRRDGAERKHNSSSTPAIRKHSKISPKFCATPSAGNKSATSREKILLSCMIYSCLDSSQDFPIR